MRQKNGRQGWRRIAGLVIVGLWVSIAGSGQIWALEGSELVDGSQINEVENEETEVELPLSCHEFEITELLTNYRSEQTEQFVELHNPTGAELSLEGCVAQTKYSGKTLKVVFGELKLAAGVYQAYSLASLGLRLAKAPSAERVFELVEGDYIDRADLPKGSVGKSFALVGDEWINATPTPSADNRSAPERVETEDETKSGADSGLVTRTPEALQPVSYPEEVEDTDGQNTGGAEGVAAEGDGMTKQYADCGEGRYRNPETNRCKKIETEEESTLKPCEEGYERNPETNRCRKIRENTVTSYEVPDSGGVAGATTGAASGGVIASAGAAVGRVFQGEDGSLQGWKVALVVGAVLLLVGGLLAYRFRVKLAQWPVYARVRGKLLALKEKISKKS